MLTDAEAKANVLLSEKVGLVMAIYRVDLKKLGQASLQVKWKSFDAINERAALAYTEWVKDQLKKQPPALQNEVCTAVSNAIKRIMMLMKGGVQGYVDFVVDQMKKINTLPPANVPIFPIMNEEIKSDAWLTGLVAESSTSTTKTAALH